MTRTRCLGVEALPVVGDGQPDPPDVRNQAHDHARGLGVLDDVVQRLDRDPVQLLLDLVVEDDAYVGSLDADGDACPGRQDRRLVPERVDQAFLGQRPGAPARR